MAKLKPYDGETFYGGKSGGENPVPGLRKEVRHGIRAGKPYSYIVFLDSAGIKWKILPTLTPKGRIQTLNLLHRNSYGSQGFHQQESAWGTTQGLGDLLRRIKEHELYELTGEKGDGKF